MARRKKKKKFKRMVEYKPRKGKWTKAYLLKIVDGQRMVLKLMNGTVIIRRHLRVRYGVTHRISSKNEDGADRKYGKRYKTRKKLRRNKRPRRRKTVPQKEKAKVI